MHQVFRDAQPSKLLLYNSSACLMRFVQHWNGRGVGRGGGKVPSQQG